MEHSVFHHPLACQMCRAFSLQVPYNKEALNYKGIMPVICSAILWPFIHQFYKAESCWEEPGSIVLALPGCFNHTFQSQGSCLIDRVPCQSHSSPVSIPSFFATLVVTSTWGAMPHQP
eukprot:166771-Pelagomonas_calceolata.AAC.2